MVENRQQALIQQVRPSLPTPARHLTRSLTHPTKDIAAEHSTMPYRAPELFDVKTGKMLDEKVDIWVRPPPPPLPPSHGRTQH